MKTKTSELLGPALDWAVGYARCLTATNGKPIQARDLMDAAIRNGMSSPSTKWAEGGPLLNRHKISRTINHSGLWIAYAGYNLNDEPRHMQCDRSELVAGLRCLVALNLGEVVDVPEELPEFTWQ